MRYTTVIDISEYSSLYRNHNVRLVYLHMALRSGYHDEDRDLLDISLRRLSIEVGLTVSATRHALSVLERAQLVSRQGNLWSVKKWIIQDQPSQRPKTTRQKKDQEESVRRDAQRVLNEVEADRRAQERNALRSKGKTQFMLYYEALVKRAQEGDADAAQLVERHRQMYETHKAELNRETKQK